MAINKGYDPQKLSLPFELAQQRTNASSIFLFGRNSDIDIETSPEMLTDFYENVPYPFLNNPEELFVSSSDAGDIITVVIRTLDTDWNVKDVVVVTDGQTPVQVPGGPYRRVLLAFNGGNVDQLGDIHIYRTSTVTGGVPDNADELMRVSQTKQQSSAAIYTVPAGYGAYLDSIVLTVNRNSNGGSSDVSLITKSSTGVRRIRGELGLQTSGSSNFTYSFPVPLRIGEKTDIWLEASTSHGGHDMAAGFQIVLIRE